MMSIPAHPMWRNDQGSSCLLHGSCTLLLVHLIPINHRSSVSLDGAWPVRIMHCSPPAQATHESGKSLGYTLKLIIQVIMRRPVGGPASNLRRRPFPQWP